jgi:hypothetical protein
MVIRRSALVWVPVFLLVGLLNVILGPSSQHPEPSQGGRRAFGAAPVAATAIPRRPTSSPSPTTHPVEGSKPPTLAVERVKARILGVEGLVQVRHSADRPWQRCDVGMVLEEGADFRVAPRSAVRFRVGPDETITLDRAGICTLLRAVKESKESRRPRPDVELIPGRLHYDIPGPIRHDRHWSEHIGPLSTRAISGTEGTA